MVVEGKVGGGGQRGVGVVEGAAWSLGELPVIPHTPTYHDTYLHPHTRQSDSVLPLLQQSLALQATSLCEPPLPPQKCPLWPLSLRGPITLLHRT